MIDTLDICIVQVILLSDVLRDIAPIHDCDKLLTGLKIVWIVIQFNMPAVNVGTIPVQWLLIKFSVEEFIENVAFFNLLLIKVAATSRVYPLDFNMSVILESSGNIELYSNQLIYAIYALRFQIQLTFNN